MNNRGQHPRKKSPLHNIFQLGLILSLKVAGFAAVLAIILPVIGQPQFVVRVAQGAVSVAGALAFRLVTHPAFEFFSGRQLSLPRSLPFQPQL